MTEYSVVVMGLWRDVIAYEQAGHLAGIFNVHNLADAAGDNTKDGKGSRCTR